MVEGKVSYLELEDHETYETLFGPRLSSKQVLVARSKLQWLGPFRKEVPVPKILENLKLPLAVRNNEFFSTSNRYTQKRIWTMQAMVYLMRLNKVRRRLIDV